MTAQSVTPSHTEESMDWRRPTPWSLFSTESPAPPQPSVFQDTTRSVCKCYLSNKKLRPRSPGGGLTAQAPEFLSSGSMFWPRAWSPNPGILLFRTRRRGLSGPERGSAGTASPSVSHREGTGRNRGHSATGVENQAQDEIPQKMEKKVFVSDSPREDSRETLSAYP